MAFRRSRSSGNRSSNRFSRFRRNRTHQPKRTGHWTRGNFNLILDTVMDTELEPSLTIAPLGQIALHLAPDTATEAQQIRFLEIGGIVFDWQMMLDDVVQDSDAGLWNVQNQMLIVTDRLDSDGIPVALTPNWFTNTTPITLAASAEGQDEDTKYPTRVHWRHSRCFNGGGVAAPTILGGIYPSQTVVQMQGSANLRLRLRLDDEHCLAVHVTSQISDDAGVLTQVAMRFMLTGSIYYRVVY